MTRAKSEAKPTIPDAPASLSQRSRELWRAVVTGPMSPGRQAIVEEALLARDRADQASGIVEADGMVTRTETTGAVHVHPLVKVERENRTLFARLWEQLGFTWSSDIDGRTKWGE